MSDDIDKADFVDFQGQLSHVIITHYTQTYNRHEGRLRIEFLDGPFKDYNFVIETETESE